MTRGATARKAREHKAAHPERYCPEPGCLYQTAGEPCPHHATGAEVRAAVAANACPRCGRPLRRNRALIGWWQCAQFGAEGFRADPAQPPCDWQGFTQ